MTSVRVSEANDHVISIVDWLKKPFFHHLVERLDDGEVLSLENFATSSQSILLAAWFFHSYQKKPRTCLWITADIRTQEDVANDLRALDVAFQLYPEIQESSQDILPDVDLQAERLRILSSIEQNPNQIILVTKKGLEQSVTSLSEISDQRRKFVKGEMKFEQMSGT